MDQSAFQALLQRPEFNRSSNDALSRELDTVTVPRSEYDRLRRVAGHFQKLKDSLINGGLSQETLDVLIYGPQSTPQRPYHGDHQTSGPSFGDTRSVNLDSRAQPVTRGKDTKGQGQGHLNGHNLSPSFDDDDDDDDEGVVLSQGSDDKDDDEPSSGGSSAAPSGQRTVLLRGLPDWVTHHEITEAIKGGAVLHIYLRGREHMVNVSFVEESAAQEFLNYAKSYGIYVAGKRVEALWSDRQFYLPPYVRNKIFSGATRNIALHNVNPTITESLIRKDLEHIHNLIVVSVNFKDGNAYISTNSVHNALFARSCMMSRFTYKGTRIAFYPDECDEPLPKVPAPVPAKAENQAPQRKRHPHANRFQLLSLDGAEDENDEFENGRGGINVLTGGISWTDNRVSV